MSTQIITSDVIADEQVNAHDIAMEMLEDERYGDTGIDEDGTLGRY